MHPTIQQIISDTHLDIQQCVKDYLKTDDYQEQLEICDCIIEKIKEIENLKLELKKYGNI